MQCEVQEREEADCRGRAWSATTHQLSQQNTLHMCLQSCFRSQSLTALHMLAASCALLRSSPSTPPPGLFESLFSLHAARTRHRHFLLLRRPTLHACTAALAASADADAAASGEKAHGSPLSELIRGTEGTSLIRTHDVTGSDCESREREREREATHVVGAVVATARRRRRGCHRHCLALDHVFDFVSTHLSSAYPFRNLTHFITASHN